MMLLPFLNDPIFYFVLLEMQCNQDIYIVLMNHITFNIKLLHCLFNMKQQFHVNCNFIDNDLHR